MRPYWKGYLKLLSSPARSLHAACSTAERITFRQIIRPPAIACASSSSMKRPASRLLPSTRAAATRSPRASTSSQRMQSAKDRDREHPHHRDRQLRAPLDPLGHCHCEKLHSLRRPRPFLQRGRSRQPARDRDPQWTAGSARRSSDPDGLHRPRRTRLSALRPIRRPAPVPPRQPALRAHLDHRHHQPRLR